MQVTDWNDFQAFLAIARAGQLARAGASLGVDATTIGRRLRRLEARLGATLFEQTREGQLLTEAGEALLVRVEAMAAAAGGIAEEGSREGGLTGTLRISVPEGFGSWFLTRHLPAFAGQHPALTIDLVANSSYLSPSKREADIAVMLSRPKAGPVIASMLSNYALRLYASPDYLDARGTPEVAPDLARGHQLVGYIPDLLYAPELRYLDEIHSGLQVSLRSSSINAQHRLLTAGAGIGVLPCFIGDMESGLARVLPELCIERSFWLVTHKDNHRLAKVAAAKKWLSELAAMDRARLIPPRI